MHILEQNETECVSCSAGLIIYDPMDSSLPDSTVSGILQARILEWVAIKMHLTWIFQGLWELPDSSLCGCHHIRLS